MRLEWLKDIVSIAETGSFSEAARRRNLTQSAFSRRVQQIEDHLGIALFDRTKKPVALRPNTAEHLDRMARMIGALNQLTDDLRRGDRMAANRLAIAAQHAISTAYAPQLLQRARDLGVDAHFRLSSANLDECFAALLSRRADLAITYAVTGDPATGHEDFIETAAIGSDRLVPVTGSAGLRRVTDALAGGTLPAITYPPDVFFGEVMNRHIVPAIEDRLRLQSHAESALTLAVLELSTAGFGVAWVPLSLAAPRIAGGEVACLDDRLPALDLTIRASRLAGSQSPVGARVWDIARSGPPVAA